MSLNGEVVSRIWIKTIERTGKFATYKCAQKQRSWLHMDYHSPRHLIHSLRTSSFSCFAVDVWTLNQKNNSLIEFWQNSHYKHQLTNKIDLRTFYSSDLNLRNILLFVYWPARKHRFDRSWNDCNGFPCIHQSLICKLDDYDFEILNQIYISPLRSHAFSPYSCWYIFNYLISAFPWCFWRVNIS